MRLALALLLSLSACAHSRAQGLRLSDREAEEIARKVYRNEAGGKPEFLVHWNQGEEFASVGIGHFIWYPRGYQGPFDESFPRLVRFLAGRGVALPDWLKDAPPCPWDTREQFLREKESPRVLELRRLLLEQMGPQARFMADRLEAALPRILAALPASQRDAVRRQFYRVAAQPVGVYALLDYVNFKGEGVKETERYNGEGWGLLQVLSRMNGTQPGQPALDEFAEAAEAVLIRRVQNSPPERGEQRWLPAWKKRVATYRTGDA